MGANQPTAAMKPDFIFPAILALALLTVIAGKLSAQDQQLRSQCIDKGNGQAECSLRIYGR
jgi:hypothetical protein